MRKIDYAIIYLMVKIYDFWISINEIKVRLKKSVNQRELISVSSWEKSLKLIKKDNEELKKVKPLSGEQLKDVLRSYETAKKHPETMKPQLEMGKALLEKYQITDV